MNKEGKAFLYGAFEYMDLQYIKTESNFIMVNIRSDDKAVFGELLKLGVIVKPGSSLGMPGFLRVSIGSMEQNMKFIKALKSVLRK
jgi:histidinol-phosphate aminotransferase